MTTDLHETDDGAADPTDDAPVSFSQMRGAWTESVFGIVAGERPATAERHTRVIVAGAIVAIAAAGASDLSNIERGLVNFLASLPGGLEPVWNVLYFLAPIAAAALLMVAAVLARNPRLLGTQALAVGLAWHSRPRSSRPP